MAKYCPRENRKVIYLYCQECEDKICQTPEPKVCSDNHESQKAKILIVDVPTKCRINKAISQMDQAKLHINI